MSAKTFFMLLFIAIFSFLPTGEVNAGSPPNDCAEGGCVFSISSPNNICDSQTKTEAQVANDPSYDYPYGLVEFVVSFPSCESIEAESITPMSPQSTTVELCFFKNEPNFPPLDVSGFIYRKYGPTPDNPTPHWYDFMYDGQTGAEISYFNCMKLYFVDGQRGDDDLTVNQRIFDQGGLGQGNISVPSMTEWGMIIFIVLAGLGAVYFMRRQKTAKS